MADDNRERSQTAANDIIMYCCAFLACALISACGGDHDAAQRAAYRVMDELSASPALAEQKTQELEILYEEHRFDRAMIANSIDSYAYESTKSRVRWLCFLADHNAVIARDVLADWKYETPAGHRVSLLTWLSEREGSLSSAWAQERANVSFERDESSVQTVYIFRKQEKPR